MALRKRGVTFLTCFRKRGVPGKGGEVPSEKGGSNPRGNYEPVNTVVGFLFLGWLSVVKLYTYTLAWQFFQHL